MERWPITLKQVALALRMRPDVVEREAKRLVTQGHVVLEPLGNDTYIALSGAGATLMGLSKEDRERLAARKPAPARPRDEQDPAFG